MTKCKKCGFDAMPGGWLFCSTCRKKQIKEMEESGYLQKVPRFSRPRPLEAREVLYETKHGLIRG